MKKKKKAKKKIKKKDDFDKKRRLLVFVIIFLALILLIIFFKFLYPTGKTVQEQVQIVPLSAEEKQKVQQAILSSEFVKDVPARNPIVLRFFKFENNQRVWQDAFLIGEDGTIVKGDPALQIYIHSKYISELGDNNLCEIVQKANKNGDLGYYSEHSKASLFIKYAGLIKHRECFGF